MKNLLAVIQIAPDNGFRGIGNGALANPGTDSVSIFSKFISSVIGVMTIVAIIWAVFSIITGAISIISSGGDKQALETARRKITMGVLGLVVVLVALLILELVGYFLGFTGLLNIECLFNLVQGNAC